MITEAARSKYSKHYARKGIYPIEQIFKLMDETGHIQYDKRPTQKVRLNGKRMRLFRDHGTRCITCGIAGVYFALERDCNASRFHANLYALKDGKEIMMTRDHVIPRSKGGLDNIGNLQVMCIICNQKKSNKENYDPS